VVGVVLLHAGRAWAPFHVSAIDEVFFSRRLPERAYVRLRLLAPGMTFVNSQHVTTQNADGSAAANFAYLTRTLPTAPPARTS
jgi:hypothetical protein